MAESSIAAYSLLDIPMDMSISRQDAHAKLHELGGIIMKHSESKPFCVDLTDGKNFDWQVYICHHTHCMDLIGGGVTTFHCEVWKYIFDHNHAYAGRVDFVLSYSDGKAVRLHPHKTRDADPITGVLDNWKASTPPGKRRLQPAILQWEDRSSVCHQFDLLGKDDAERALKSMTGGEGMPKCIIDISDIGKPGMVPFQWWRWILNRRDGEKIIGKGISHMHLAWVPARWLQTADMKEGWHYVATRIDGSFAIFHPKFKTMSVWWFPQRGAHGDPPPARESSLPALKDADTDLQPARQARLLALQDIQAHPDQDEHHFAG